MKKTLFAITILLGVSVAVSAQDGKRATTKKAIKTETRTDNKVQPIKVEVLTDRQIKANKIKAKMDGKKPAKSASKKSAEFVETAN